MYATIRPVSTRHRVYNTPALKTNGDSPRCSKQVITMGLEAFASEDEQEEENSITTRKKLKNVNFEESFYEWLIMNNRGVLDTAAAYTGESSVKAMVQRMDEILEDGLEDQDVTEIDEEYIQQSRDTLVENYLE
jgi:hypothetical protein